MEGRGCRREQRVPRRTYRRIGLLLGIAGATTAAADTLPPIVVTATRTESRLLEVPVPITVVAPAAIEAAAVRQQ